MRDIADDEQRRARPQPTCALWVSGGVPASAALPLLDKGPPCRRRGAWHLPARRSERDPCHYSDRLLKLRRARTLASESHVAGELNQILNRSRPPVRHQRGEPNGSRRSHHHA